MSNIDELQKRLAFQKKIEFLISEEDSERVELPSKIGISSTTFSRVVNYGIIPKTKTLIKIADYFKTSIDFLIGITQNNDFIASNGKANFYIRLEELRNKAGYKNYSQLANATHIPRQYFNDWPKRLTYPTMEIIEYLANFFHVSIDYLLGRTDF